MNYQRQVRDSLFISVTEIYVERDNILSKADYVKS